MKCKENSAANVTQHLVLDLHDVRRVRCVEADLLSDKGQLRGSGDRRIGTQEAGPA
jgi:hypothetical protein